MSLCHFYLSSISKVFAHYTLDKAGFVECRGINYDTFNVFHTRILPLECRTNLYSPDSNLLSTASILRNAHDLLERVTETSHFIRISLIGHRDHILCKLGSIHPIRPVRHRVTPGPVTSLSTSNRVGPGEGNKNCKRSRPTLYTRPVDNGVP
jgi:hypothetical protein